MYRNLNRYIEIVISNAKFIIFNAKFLNCNANRYHLRRRGSRIYSEALALTYQCAIELSVWLALV